MAAAAGRYISEGAGVGRMYRTVQSTDIERDMTVPPTILLEWGQDIRAQGLYRDLRVPPSVGIVVKSQVLELVAIDELHTGCPIELIQCVVHVGSASCHLLVDINKIADAGGRKLRHKLHVARILCTLVFISSPGKPAKVARQLFEDIPVAPAPYPGREAAPRRIRGKDSSETGAGGGATTSTAVVVKRVFARSSPAAGSSVVLAGPRFVYATRVRLSDEDVQRHLNQRRYAALYYDALRTLVTLDRAEALDARSQPLAEIACLDECVWAIEYLRETKAPQLVWITVQLAASSGSTGGVPALDMTMHAFPVGEEPPSGMLATPSGADVPANAALMNRCRVFYGHPSGMGLVSDYAPRPLSLERETVAATHRSEDGEAAHLCYVHDLEHPDSRLYGGVRLRRPPSYVRSRL